MHNKEIIHPSNQYLLPDSPINNNGKHNPFTAIPITSHISTFAVSVEFEGIYQHYGCLRCHATYRNENLNCDFANKLEWG